MNDQILIWINGLRSNSTEYINECNQCLFELSQDSKNLPYFVDIIKESTDLYIINASLLFLRFSVSKHYQDFTKDFLMELLINILDSFSNTFDFSLLQSYKSLIKFLTYVIDNDELPNILLNFFQLNEKSNQPATIILVNILLKIIDFNESYEIIFRNFYFFAYSFLKDILSVDNSDYKVYLLYHDLHVLDTISYAFNEKLDLNVISHFLDLFRDPTISSRLYFKLWSSVSRIFSNFDEFFSHEQILVALIQSSLYIPDPFYFYCSALAFVPFIKTKSVPLEFIKLLISCEISVSIKLNNDPENLHFEDEVIKNVINYYNEDEEVFEIFKHVMSVIESKSTSEATSALYYGYIIKACNHTIKLDVQDVIQFFDELFTEDSDEKVILACLYSIAFIIDSTFNYIKELLIHFSERILICTISDNQEIRSNALAIIGSNNFDIGPSINEFYKMLLDNRENYLENNPYDFFVILISCTNTGLPIPDSYYEESINDVLIPLIKIDYSYLSFLAGLISSNEFWIETYLQMVDPFFESQIDNYIAEITDGSFYRNSEFDSIIGFYSILLENYQESFFEIEKNNILKICNLFYSIEVLDEDFYSYLSTKLSCAFKYITDTEECDKLTEYLFSYSLKSNFLNNCAVFNVLNYTIRYASIEITTVIMNHIIHDLINNENELHTDIYFEVLGSIFKNQELTEDMCLQVSHFLKDYYKNNALDNSNFHIFSYLLGKIMYRLPDYNEWLQFLFSNIETMESRPLILNSFFYSCIFKNLLKNNLTQSENVDDLIVELAISIFNDPNPTNDFKTASIHVLSMIIENKRSEAAIQFFLENIESFIQFASDSSLYFCSQSAVMILHAASLNLVEFNVELLIQCCKYFPDDIDFHSNIFFIRYSLDIMSEDNENVYAEPLEQTILICYFNYLIKSYQISYQIRGNDYDKMIQCFIVLANKNPELVQQRINELEEFPSAQRRIISILNPQDNE